MDNLFVFRFLRHDNFICITYAITFINTFPYIFLQNRIIIFNSYCLHNNKSIFPAFFNCLLVSHHHFVLLSLRSGNLASEMWFSKETPQTDPGHLSLKRSERISPFSLSINLSTYLSISYSLSLSLSATLTLSFSRSFV